VRVTQGAQTFTDLSAAGRANCYIVAPKSASVFDAAYKGNSSTESIGAAEGAELVWQSAQGLVTRVAYAADEKKIIVETADKSGNAVVAAVDESGSDPVELASVDRRLRSVGVALHDGSQCVGDDVEFHGPQSGCADRRARQFRFARAALPVGAQRSVPRYDGFYDHERGLHLRGRRRA